MKALLLTLLYLCLSTITLQAGAVSPYLGNLMSGEASDVSYGLLGDYVQIFEESNLSAVEFDALQPGSFTLVSLDFTVDVLAIGDSTTVSIGTIWGLSDGNHDQQLEVDSTNDAVISNPATSVPEPGALLLINLGLLGLLAARKRVSEGWLSFNPICILIAEIKST